MKLKVFKYISVLCFTLVFNSLLSQDFRVPPDNPEKAEPLTIKLHTAPPIQFKDLAFAMSEVKPIFERPFENDFSQSFGKFDQLNQENSNSTINTVEKSKKITKTYAVSTKDKLAIDNQYGDVSINTWNKNEIKVDVIIKGFGATDNEAIEFLEGVSINDSRQSGLIAFRTAISKNKSSWWGIKRKLGGEEKRGVQVNYQIYMPSKNSLDITNKYGSTSVPSFEGALNLNISYGSFSGQTLSNPANKIDVKYGSASIANLVSGNVKVSYGSLQIENSERLNADISYSSAKIGKLQQSGDIHIKYSGGFKIEEIGSKLKDLNIDAAYSAVSLGFNPSSNFKFDVTVNYAGFKYDESKVNITSKTPDDNERGFKPSKNYKGSYGKSSSSNIIIRSNYGSVKFL